MNIFQINENAFKDFFISTKETSRICFVSTYVPNPRLNKRISEFASHGG